MHIDLFADLAETAGFGITESETAPSTALILASSIEFEDFREEAIRKAFLCYFLYLFIFIIIFNSVG